MAQTVGTVLAKEMAIYVGGSPDVIITCQIDATLSMSTATFDTTCKSSGAWADSNAGTKSWTMSGTGNFADDAANGFLDLQALWVAGSTAEFVMSTGATGDTQHAGNGIVTELELTSAGNDTAVTFSYTVTGKGALASTVIS